MLMADVSGLSLLGGLATGGMTNMLNSIQNEDQRDWSEKMWRLNNEYNTPENQIKRLRRAGVNPHFAISGGQLSSGTSSSQADLTSPHPYDFSPVAEGLSKSAELYQQQRFQDADIGLKNQQAENMRIRNDYEDRRQWLELLKLENDSSLSSEQKEKVRSERELLEKDLETRGERNRVEIERVKSEQALAKAQTAYVNAQKVYQDALNKFAPAQQRIITENLRKQGREIESSINKNNRDAALAAANEALTKAQKAGVTMDNDTKYNLMDLIVDEKYYQTEFERYKTGNEKKLYFGGHPGYEIPRFNLISTDQREEWWKKTDVPKSRYFEKRKRSDYDK